jgi:hypothetical protein
MKASKMRVTVIVLFSALSTLLAGCENEDIRAWRDETKALRITAEREIPSAPYRREEHLAFKAYFASLGTMALSLRQDAGKPERFNEAASREGIGRLCQDVFMNEASWQRLMEGCTKNRFFLCAEEVRAYPSFVRALRERLRPELQRRFDEAPLCAAPRMPEAQGR